MKIYTKTGDTGETGLYGGRRVRKDDPRIEACGDVDELNCVLGIARTHAGNADLDAILERIQNDLFALGADLATPDETSLQHGRTSVTRIGSDEIDRLEADIDALEARLTPLSRFILPGGSATAAQLHHARAVCRRAERRCASLMKLENCNPMTLIYLNRLSDLLFVAARYSNHCSNVPDVPWDPRDSSHGRKPQ